VAVGAGAVTSVDALRLAYGSLLVLRPDALLGSKRVSGSDERIRSVVRVLGARHVVQAVIVGTWPTGPCRRVGAAVDALHSITDVAFARLDARRRRAAALDAAIAVALGAANMRLAQGSGRH
jgi:hypothetical protein